MAKKRRLTEEQKRAAQRRGREWYWRNQDVQALRGLDRKREAATGHSAEYFEARVEEQDGACAICRTPLRLNTRHTHADHDHAVKKPRGVLCHRCNHGVGWLEHPLTAAMLAYIEHWRLRNG